MCLFWYVKFKCLFVLFMLCCGLFNTYLMEGGGSWCCCGDTTTNTVRLIFMCLLLNATKRITNIVNNRVLLCLCVWGNINMIVFVLSCGFSIFIYIVSLLSGVVVDFCALLFIIMEEYYTIYLYNSRSYS